MHVNVHDFVFTYIFFITRNKKLVGFVEECLKSNNGDLIVNVCDRFSKNFGFKNSSNKHLYINIDLNSGTVYVYNENDSGYEDFSYCKGKDSIVIDYNSISWNKAGNVSVANCTDEYGKYDLSGNLLNHRCSYSKYTNIDGEVAQRLMGSNYDKVIEDIVVDKKLYRCVDLDYYYLDDFNKREFFVSDYKKDMFLNENSDICPKFSLYDGDVSFIEEKFDFMKKSNVKNKKL